MDHERAAAALLARDDHLAAFGGQHAHRGRIDLGEQHPLHAPRQQADALAHRALRRDVLGRLAGAQLAQGEGRQQGFHRAQLAGEQLHQPRASHQRAQP